MIGQLACSVSGAGSRSLLLLHGLGADHRQSQSLVPPSLRNWRRLAPDLRGHGATTLPCEARHLSFARLAADVEEAITGPVVVIGVSMGAAVALELAARRRLLIEGAILIRPAWRWSPNPPNLAIFPVIAALLTAMNPPEAKAALIANPEYARVAATSELAARALLGQLDEAGAAQRADRLRAMPGDAPRRPPACGVPVLVIGNEQDPVHPAGHAQALAEDLGADFRTVPPRYDSPAEHMVGIHHEIQRALECL